ncbi:hypothetical protein BV22DRAFT_1083525 [Leucogyrophana mollusca]|uniref:Uncharacterized protein n=1 Tax=Leucogyrophana mollusca TaxID=85980 RepID=A0ACB8BR53_9AGAM|nr:hypothetical protein BV22DRAFT_1083525 [Leucogyrophana mollusca]
MQLRAALLLSFPALIYAQSCSNYGVESSSSSCLCPPGFGGSTCAEPGCGGTIFDGSNRPLAQASSSGGFPNLTASGCTCESGWAGTGCNVCTSSAACQSGYAKISGSTTPTGETGVNDTMVCNTAPTVYAAGELSCQVNNPTLQAIYPLQSTLNILRTLNASLSPLSSASSISLPTSSISAQLFYAGIEQFACSASPCTQSTTNSSSTNTTTWTCENLACTCVPNTTFCGGVPVSNLTTTINGLTGTLTITCDTTSTCHFQQSVLQNLFGSAGLAMEGCVFGECVAQGFIDAGNGITAQTSAGGTQLGGGVIAGLVVVGSLIFIALVGVAWGYILQRKARRGGSGGEQHGGVGVQFKDISFLVRSQSSSYGFLGEKGEEKTILDCVSGSVEPGRMMAVLGPSGAGKTTLVELIAGKHKAGISSGSITFPASSSPTQTSPRIAFVPQHDTLPSALTVREALTFAARLRLPESLTSPSPSSASQPNADFLSTHVQSLITALGLSDVADTRIGSGGGSEGGMGAGGRGRGISGGEARRVSIGLELVGCPDVLVLDEPTSGLDSVSAMRVVRVLGEVARGGVGGGDGSEEGKGRIGGGKGVAVVMSVHQPSSRLYHTFDSVLLLSHGRALYSGPGGFAPVEHLSRAAGGGNAGSAGGGGNQNEGAPHRAYPEGYNVADYLLEIASDPPVGLFRASGGGEVLGTTMSPSSSDEEKGLVARERGPAVHGQRARGTYAATFLTQLEVLCGREWKVLRRDKSLFVTHVCVASVLGVFCGGLYYQTGTTIAGFQSRIGCLFFLGALIAFSSLSALANIVEIRPLFMRERSNAYYSPTAWLLSRFLFDVVPLRIIPTIIVSSVTYWMAGLAHDAAHFFKFLFILVLYTLVMTLFNFLLGAFFRNGGIAILLSALTALYQMTFAGFFVHLESIPPVLRWLQWLCPLKARSAYTLEALSVNEVGSGLMIQDQLQGVPVDVSATLIMQLLFGFGTNNYYRDVLVLFAFIAGFGVAVIGVVWIKVRERR